MPEDIKTVITILAFVLVLVIFLPLIIRGSRKPKSTYELRDCLLTPAERNFFGVLQQAVGTQYLIALKVRMADVVGLKSGLDGKERQAAWNRISQKHFDFVLCAPDTSAFLAILELDDKSHRNNNRTIESDQFKESCLKQIGLPLIRFNVKSAYNMAEIRERINTALGGATPPPLSPAPPSACPRCGAPLITRTAKNGPHRGKSFNGCSRFPDCRYTGSLTEA